MTECSLVWIPRSFKMALIMRMSSSEEHNHINKNEDDSLKDYCVNMGESSTFPKS